MADIELENNANPGQPSPTQPTIPPDLIKDLANKHAAANQLVVASGITSIASLIVINAINFKGDATTIAFLSFLSVIAVLKIIMIFLQYHIIEIHTHVNTVISFIASIGFTMVINIADLVQYYQILSIIEALLMVAVISLSGYTDTSVQKYITDNCLISNNTIVCT